MHIKHIAVKSARALPMHPVRAQSGKVNLIWRVTSLALQA